MKFHVSRTSIWDDEKSPCEEAAVGRYLDVDERTVNDPKKLKINKAEESWYNSGHNHRVENGHIKRDFIRDGWMLELNSLEDLIKFSEKYGDLVVSSESGSPTIEIYDGFRE